MVSQIYIVDHNENEEYPALMNEFDLFVLWNAYKVWLVLLSLIISLLT